MIAVPSGASGRSTVQRSTRNAPPSSHSNRTRPSPGHGGPPGGAAAIVHSPTKRSSALSIVSAVGWSTVAAPPSPAGRSGRQVVVWSVAHGRSGPDGVGERPGVGYENSVSEEHWVSTLTRCSWPWCTASSAGLLLVALGRNPAARAEKVELLALRHEVRVLRRQVKRSAWRPRDRLLLAALSRCLPRAEWGRFPVRPETLLRWHRELVRRKWAAFGRRRGPGRPPLAPRAARADPAPGPGEPHLGLRAHPGRTPQAGARRRGEHDPGAPAPAPGAAGAPAGGARLAGLPAGARRRAAGLRLLHRGDGPPADALRPVLPGGAARAGCSSPAARRTRPRPG